MSGKLGMRSAVTIETKMNEKVQKTVMEDSFGQLILQPCEELKQVDGNPTTVC